VATEAAREFAGHFDQLESAVDSKRDALVDELASRYTQARDAVDAEISAAQAENKGLWDKAKEAVGGAIETIKKLKDLLMGALSRAAGAIEKIIKDPIGFLGRLVSAVKSGIQAFAANIATHLKSGLMGWLFGELGKSGLELPKSFDFKGILGMVLSLLGLTWAAIRARIVKALGRSGEKIMATLEKVFEPFVVLVTQGPAGLWKFVKEKLSDLKEQVLGPIKDFVITKVIVAGVTWLVSMLNPASAFIKACKAIYDIVMFLVNRAMELAEFVNSIVDSFAAIASGAMGAVSSMIEKTLGRILPLAISFLASLLGLGGIGEKIKSIFQAIQKPVMKAVDMVIKPAIKLGKKLLKKLFGRKKGKKQKGKKDPAAVKAKVKSELAGKHLAGKAQAHRLLTSTYAKYKPEGLKSLELRPDSGGESATVLVRASAAEALKLETDPKKLAAIAVKFDTMSKTTRMEVSYAGKHFKSYTNRKPLHAEGHFQRDAARLVAKIKREQAKGKLKPGPVPVTIEMNRLPCDHCAQRLLDILAANSQYISLQVHAASDYKKSWDSQADLLSDAKLKQMIQKGIEIRPLHIWPIIERQARAQGIKELVYGRRIIDLNLAAGMFASHAHDVEDRLKTVNAQIKRDELKGEKVP
ncbi:MAG: phage tail protein, partial [Actinomycetota bacterium]